VNAATPMVDCYSAKSGRFARNLELLGPIAHWLGRALLVRGLPPPTACPTPTSVPAAPGPNLTPVKEVHSRVLHIFWPLNSTDITS